MDYPCIVVYHMRAWMSPQEVAILLEVHTGEGTVVDNDSRTQYSKDKTRLLLAMSSQSAVDDALKLRYVHVRKKIVALLPWSNTWDRHEPMCTTTPDLKELSKQLLSIDVTLYDHTNDADGLIAEIDDLLAAEILTPSTLESGNFEEVSVSLPGQNEKMEFAYQLLQERASRKGIQIERTDTRKVRIIGNPEEVHKFKEKAFDIIVSVDSQVMSEFSAEGANVIHNKCLDQMLGAFRNRNISASIDLHDSVLILVALDSDELEKAKNVLDTVLLKQSFTLSDESLKATQTADWKKMIDKVSTPPKIHVYVNDSDGGPHVVVEGLADFVFLATSKLQEWLKENANTTVILSFSPPIWHLLKERVKDEIIPDIKGLPRPKMNFVEEKENQHILEISGAVDTVEIMRKHLMGNAKGLVKSASTEITKPGIKLSLFTEQPGKGRLNLIEIANKCVINVRRIKTVEHVRSCTDLSEMCVQMASGEDETKETALSTKYMSTRIRKEVGRNTSKTGKTESETEPYAPLLAVHKGDLTKYKADILVCTVVASAKTLNKGGALGKVFAITAGEDLNKGYEAICQQNTNSIGHLPLGEANITSATGQLDCKQVIFLGLRHWQRGDYVQLKKVVELLIGKCLDKAKEVGATSIAFPTIGCGAFHFPPKLVAGCLKTIVDGWKKVNSTYSLQVNVVSHEDKLKDEFDQVITIPPTELKEKKTEVLKTPKPRGASNMPTKGLAQHTIRFEIYATERSLLEEAKSNLIDILPTVLNRKLIHETNLEKINEAEMKELENIRVDGANLEMDQAKLILTGDEKAVKQLKSNVMKVLQRLEERVTDPYYILEHSGNSQFLIALSEEQTKIPPHWRKRSGFKVLWDAFTGTEYLQEVDTKTKYDIERLVQQTWSTIKVGSGKDASGLSHKSIRVVNVLQNENRDVYLAYKDYFKETCKKVGRGDLSVQKIDGLDGEDEVLTNKLKIPTLEKIRVHQINEVFLFHGTTNDCKDVIAKQGLDSRVVNAGLFGRGVYFAESSSKADQYSDRGDRHDGDHYMYLCRVIIRDPFVAKTSLNDIGRPPCKEQGCHKSKCPRDHEFHDSVLGVSKDEGKHRLLFREFIVYDKRHCYPEFLIKYERVD